MCITGLSIRHVAERFQHSNETILKYFKKILFALSSPPFYPKYVHLPHTSDPVPAAIINNPKWFPFFDGAIGAMDGTHITCHPSAAE
ncbi:hypothetical protein BDQ17DRAFT_1240847 [Cyathus striatus]|nr:hypothetical protein BDQ17DRAFT_1240847 [Cyathus striatus]